MVHDIKNYSVALNVMHTIRDQLSENLLSRMDDEFDKTLEEPDHKLRSKLVKQHNRNVQDVTPVVHEIYPMQVRMTQIETNLSFVLENACYNKSYLAVARYFAEYDFLSQQIKKEVGKVKNSDVLKDFLERSSVLNNNWFDSMTATLAVMKQLVVEKMKTRPEIYIDLDVEKDSEWDFEAVKAEYKNTLKKLKEDLKKQKAGV
jgi:hypothetical protein